MTRRRQIGRSSSTSSSPGHVAGEADTCRYCSARIRWLVHSRTQRFAPIDLEPAPGGNVLVLRDTGGRLTGYYGVVGKGERTLFDTTTEDLDATPSLHFNHWATCTSPTARRFARERSKTRKDTGT